MTTEEKNELLMQAEYHRGMADAFMEAAAICTNHEECTKIHNLAIKHANICKAILEEIQD